MGKKKKSVYDQPWKAIKCGASEDCWCRMIVLKSLKNYSWSGKDYDDDKIIVGAGNIEGKFARYVTKLHNEELKRQKLIEK